MKYIILSFDDGRKDFYTNALPILKKYCLPATLNVISDFVGKVGIDAFSSGDGKCLSWDEIKESRGSGVEIASHSANHTNAVPEVIRGSEEIAAQLKLPQKLGFASPNSSISIKNFSDYRDLLSSGQIKYIRSGNQLKRDGCFNILLYLYYKYTKSVGAFVQYNRRNIISVKKQSEPFFFPSVTCNRDNTMKQLMGLVQKMPDESAAIIMFHSVLKESDPGFGKDKWFNTAEEFDQFCKFLSSSKEVRVITNENLFDLMQ